MANRLIRWLKEPLVHFLLIGAAIYVVYGLFGTAEESGDDRTVTITAGEVQSLANNWQRQWGRPPTANEFDGVVTQYIREIVLSREAVAMGLDADDIVIRRRLAQKLEFLSQDLMVPPDPKPEELEEWFDARIDEYREPNRYTLTHIYLDPDKRDEQALADAEALRDELNALAQMPADVRAYGDPFMLQNYYPQRTALELSKLFGRGFAESAIELEPGVWHGPVLSGYGVHVVRIDSPWRAPDPEFSSVEAQVREDWIAVRSEELNRQFLDAVLARYDVIVEEVDVSLTPGPARDQGAATGMGGPSEDAAQRLADEAPDENARGSGRGT